jgi:hypothetical protein
VGSLDYDDPDGKSKSYDPRGGAPGASTRRQLFFATTPKAQAQPKKPGEVVYSTWLHRQQDVFHPDMLQRYLAGYDPGQSEQFRFCDDPLRAHFLQDHIAALAKAYGFDLKVAVRRVDRPGPQYAAPQLLTPAWSFITDPSFLSETDRVRYVYAEESECSQPLPGSTATVTEPLEPQAWYDIFVLAQSLDAAFADGTLPGVTFKTSRWRTPAEMMAGLGLTVAGGPAPAAVVTGDLAVQTPGSLAPAVAEDDDGAFEAALTSLGLDDWPPADSPRLSRLWTSEGAGSWLFAGLMVESPEPIHRPGRVELTGLSLDMGIAQGGISFDIRRRDRLGARLLYLTSTPFQVVTSEVVPIFLGFKPFPRRVSISPQLILHTTRKDTSGTGPLDGSLIIPAVPDFAGDPS